DALGADRQAVAGALAVAAGEDAAVVHLQRRADHEARERRVRALARLGREVDQATHRIAHVSLPPAAWQSGSENTGAARGLLRGRGRSRVDWGWAAAYPGVGVTGRRAGGPWPSQRGCCSCC